MKVEEKQTEVVIDLKSINLPGWVWIAIAGLAMYLARTYISDSGLIELIGLGIYMGLKYVEVQVNKGQLDAVSGWIGRAHNEILGWRARSAPEAGMRSATTEVAMKPLVIEKPNAWFNWMFD